MPFLPLPRFYGITDREKIQLPMPDDEELATKPQREIRRIRPFYNFHRLSPEEIRYCRGCFYDLCAELDSAIGQVFDALKRFGLWEDTIIVLNTDHGATLGEHGLGTIRTFYEPVVQVPLIWSWPGHLPEGRTVNDPVEQIDLLPTLMNLVGITVPSGIDGRSLVPQMRDDVRDPHRPTFSEYDTAVSPIGGADWIPEEAWWYPVSDHRVMVRRYGWKLEYNHGDSEYGEDGALYHLQQDPYELINLFDRAETQSKVEELKQVSAEWLRRVGKKA
jgi:arylsulfatase A-like enzyme